MVTLKALNISYLDKYLALVNSVEVHKTTEPTDAFEAYERDQIAAWLTSLQGKTDRKDFAIIEQSSGAFVGEVVLNDISGQTANIRIAILPSYFDKGFGTQAIQQCTHYGFEQLGLTRITLDVFSINPRGMRVYEKCGFQEVQRTKINDDIDEIHMQLVAGSS